MPTKRSSLAAATLDGQIYVCGGHNVDHHFLDVCERYDPSTDNWDTIAGLNIKRSGSAMVATDEALYVLGGGTAYGEDRGTVEVYDRSENKWTLLREKLKGHRLRNHISAVVFNRDSQF